MEDIWIFLKENPTMMVFAAGAVLLLMLALPLLMV